MEPHTRPQTPCAFQKAATFARVNKVEVTDIDLRPDQKAEARLPVEPNPALATEDWKLKTSFPIGVIPDDESSG